LTLVEGLDSQRHVNREHAPRRTTPSIVRSTLLTLTSVASVAACEPPFELIALLPRFLFRSGLVDIVVPMLSTCVGFVARIKAFLSRPTPVASPARRVSPPPGIRRRRTTVIFPR
jgi:hypothetical protein